jgi:hypothetical protein
MKIKIITLIALFALVVPAFALTTVTVNDRGAIRADCGQVCRVVRSDAPVRAATTLFARSYIPFIHGIVPGGPLQTLVLEDLRFARRDHSCISAETLAGRLELAFSFSRSGVDSVEDLFTDPIAVCPVIVPPASQTSRTFFSSTARPQGTGLDDFITGFQMIGAGNPFVIRFIPEPVVGLEVDLSDVIIKTGGNPDLETGLLDEGGLPLMYLGTTADSVIQRSFTGLLIYVPYTREPWTSNRIQLSLTVAGFGWDLMSRSFWPIYPNEDATTGIMVWGLTRQDMATIPYNSPQIYSPEGPCRADHITVRYQP